MKTMIPSARAVCSLSALFLTCALLPAGSAAEPAPRLGINLAGAADWSTELPLVDLFRFSRQWISQRTGAAWGQGPKLKLDRHGWIQSLEDGCFAETPLCTIENGHYPSGRYVVRYEGQGEFDFGGAARLVSQDPGRITIDVDARKGPIWLRLRRVNPDNYPRHIQVFVQDREKMLAENRWSPEFLARWQGFACLRFMDLQDTNNSEIESWDDRPQLDDATWTRRGLPVEVLCDLANRLQIDPWFCLPHRANDDYVRRFAKLVKERLAPERRVYLEYSNEVWNGQFAQHRYAAEQGQRLGLAEKSWEAAWKYTGLRSKQIFTIWQEEFGGRERIVRVLAGQAANPYVCEQVLLSAEAYRDADALAIAPYFSWNVPADKAAAVAALSIAAALEHVENTSLPQAIRWMQDNKKVADRYGLKLMAYEAGQHLVGVGGGENNEQLTALFHTLNRHPRMGEFHRTYYDAWAASGGDLMCVFSSVSNWSKWGSWGLLEYADQPADASPKVLATLRWAQQHGQPVKVP